ncbi:hypothetical protein F5Y07DRAFT_359200 [Xylaria sp. FL0933]|nr:hypothetical protein F5Y07DRAFT_359200 [Xylaria sp. FL0933]
MLLSLLVYTAVSIILAVSVPNNKRQDQSRSMHATLHDISRPISTETLLVRIGKFYSRKCEWLFCSKIWNPSSESRRETEEDGENLPTLLLCRFCIRMY